MLFLRCYAFCMLPSIFSLNREHAGTESESLQRSLQEKLIFMHLQVTVLHTHTHATLE